MRAMLAATAEILVLALRVAVTRRPASAYFPHLDLPSMALVVLRIVPHDRLDAKQTGQVFGDHFNAQHPESGAAPVGVAVHSM